jgi:hypothetical protein
MGPGGSTGVDGAAAGSCDGAGGRAGVCCGESCDAFRKLMPARNARELEAEIGAESDAELDAETDGD